jgi:LemA protein
MNILWYIIIIIAVVVVWIIGIYNALIRLRQRVKEAFSDIDVQLKRRHNLIPNLVNTVQGYAKHEKGVFEEVTKARTAAMSAQGTLEQAQAENMLSNTLKSLFAVAENYPDLKASQNFLQLQDELSDTENKIQAARRFYNGQVRDFNTKQEVFPSNLIANLFKFKKADYFEIELEAERAVPEVDFSK